MDKRTSRWSIFVGGVALIGVYVAAMIVNDGDAPWALIFLAAGVVLLVGSERWTRDGAATPRKKPDRVL